MRASAGKLDVATLQAVAPSAARSGHLHFRAEFPTSAITPAVSFAEASKIAEDVALGRLGYGQLYGFMLRYGAADDWSVARLPLPVAAELIKSLNRGEMSQAGLEKALDTKTYFPSSLADKIWRRMFSGTSSKTGNKYTVSGVASASTYTAPFTRRLTPELAAKLADDDGLRQKFAQSFQKYLDAGLPSGIKMFWLQRQDGDSRWEAELYDGIVAAALAAARRDTGL